MKIGYDNTLNKQESSSPLLFTDPDKKKRRYQVLPDPKVTKPKVARQMKQDGVITKDQFRTYKDQYRANNTRRRPAITSGDTGGPNSKGDGGPNENFDVVIPRRKWNRKVRMEKRGSKNAAAYDKKLRESSPRHTEHRQIPKSERTEEELKYRIDVRRVKVNDTKKEAKKRYKNYKK